jgi:hypothetical protein
MHTLTRLLRVPNTSGLAVRGLWRFLSYIALKRYKSLILPRRHRTYKAADTTGFSRVEIQFHTRTRLLDLGKIPPTLVAWSFNFCRLLLVVERES